MEPVSTPSGQTEHRNLVEDFLANRDERAFLRLYRECTPVLFQLVYRLVGRHQADAEEVAQETWIRAVERLHEFRWESRFTTWLSGIAVNRCRELFRQRAKRNAETELDDTYHAELSLVVTQGEQLDLEDAIAALPDGYRAVLVLHDVEGYAHNEIAEMLGIEVGTSKSQLSRARGSIRRSLTELK